MSLPHPVVEGVAGVRETVRFVKRSALEALPTPWPRCQDLPSSSTSQPEKDDFVVAVSHIWPYQAHPDPLGEKGAVLRDLTEQACAAHRPRGRTLFFVDFLSTDQRPFARGQAPRTPAQEDAFATALRAFPLIYLMADATIHLDVELSEVPEDMHEYMVAASDLRGVRLQVVGPTVQVMDFEMTDCAVAPFDIVSSIEGASVKSIEDVDRFRVVPAPAQAGDIGWPWCQGCYTREMCTVHMRRAPYGRRNTLPANAKGWIFLERFVSMVKIAMVPESRMASVAFSNSPGVLEQIRRGGARLRAAAAGGRATLSAALQEFAKELDSKEFSTTSMDTVMNAVGAGEVPTGGVKVVKEELKDTSRGASDRDVVWELMQLLVAHLEGHWEAEATAQRQRQLVLAVCRGDVADVVQLIGEGADPNAQDAAGCTSLHAAASFRQVDMVRTLLQHRADTLVEDRLGNMPIHLLSYLSQDATVELFELLAPSKRELAKANVAGISPLKKLATWVDIECRDAPFLPAQRCLERLRASFPDVLLMRTPGSVRRTSLYLVPAAKGLESLTVGGRSVSVPVWEPSRGGAKVHVVFFALQWALPWSLTEAATGLLAWSICDRFAAKIWVITTGALDARLLAEGAPLASFHEDLEAVVRALPMGGEGFFVLDSSLGMCVPVFWRFPELIRGALILNACCFFSEEFEGSQMHAMLAKLFEKQLGLARAADPEQQAAMHAQWSTAVCYDDLSQRRGEYKAAWAAAPEHCWLWWAYGNLDIMALTRVLSTLPPLPGLPVTFAVGSLAAASFTTEPLSRFQKILPTSKVAYIPDSRYFWDFEGEEPVCKVASLLCELMEEQLGSPLP